MLAVHRISERIGLDVKIALIPIVVIALAEQDPDLEVDVDEIGGDLLTVNDDAGGDEHRAPPIGHVPILVIAFIGILEGAPAAEQDAASPDFLVTRQRFVKKSNRSSWSGTHFFMNSA